MSDFERREEPDMNLDPIDDPREELALVEQELKDVGDELEELRRELGEQTDGAGDIVDHTNLIEEVAMVEALVEGLRARREELRQLLGSKHHVEASEGSPPATDTTDR
jgi:DNA repair exonuclease SbcCD ATPase subunit